MKYVLLLLSIAFAGPVLGQDVKPAAGDNPQTANWSRLGPTVEGARGFTLSGRGIRLNRGGQYEMWVKIEPTDAAVFVKQYYLPQGTSYVLQYATLDCGRKLLSLDKTAAYGPEHKRLEGRVSGITPSSKRSTVRPGSIGEAIFKYVCEEPTALPMTRIK